MRFLFILLIILLSTSPFFAQQQPKEMQPRVLILLDGSGSMEQEWSGGQNRFQTAAKIIAALIDSVYKVNSKVEFALRVYGHQYPSKDNNCYDTRLEVMFSKDNLTQMELRLAALHPYGVTPIAYSIKEAAEKDMTDEYRNTYSLVLITDGGESCGGNICDVVKKLLEKKINFKPYILSLVDYAPLKEQYNCLGNYLLVTSNNDIKKAVGTIVDAYRPMFTMTTINKKLVQDIPTPPVVSQVPVKKIEIVTEPVKKEEPKPVITEPVKKEEPKPIMQEPDLTSNLLKESVAKMQPIAIKRLPNRWGTANAGTVTTFSFVLPPVQKEPEQQPITIPLPNPTPAKLVAKPKAEAPKPPEGKLTVKREEAKETLLSIYFTDGKGKYYHTTPQIVLTDTKTGKQQKFYRSTDANGNPDSRQIPVGIYDITVTKSKRIWKNIEVLPNQNNKIELIVGNASLRFEYEDNRSEPVSDYVALVKKALERGPITRQLCTQELEYEPGNYHISINTLPRMERNDDLQADAEVVITMKREGFIQFTNTNALGRVKLYYELGDQFSQFYEIDITGNPEAQKVKLQRGRYRVGYNKTPNVPYSRDTYREFTIKSKETTELQLD
jgi:hypothetical protein